MDRAQFNEALVSLVEYAGANAGHVSTDDVKIYFKDFFTEDSQYSAVYDYLKSSKITIDDLPGYDVIEADNANSRATSDSINNPEAYEDEAFTNKADLYNNSGSYDNVNGEDDNANEAEGFVKPLESEEELAFLKMYENEISSYNDITAEEKLELIQAFLDGNTDIAEKIATAYLPTIHAIAQTYSGQVVSLGDLIQEGNIGMLMAISEFDGAAAEFDDFIQGKVRSAMDLAIGEQAHSNRINDHLAGRMNNLDDLSRNLTEKLGRAPSVAELAEEMNITEDEVDTIIRTSLNVLTVEESKKQN